MKVLVLDDNEIVVTEPDREIFPEAIGYVNAEIVQTRSVKEFVKLFFTTEFDQVWIDHDLGTDPVNGRTATKEIHDYIRGSGRTMVAQDFSILITTMNPSVSKTMISDLQVANPDFRIENCPITFLAHQGISRGEVIPV